MPGREVVEILGRGGKSGRMDEMAEALLLIGSECARVLASEGCETVSFWGTSGNGLSIERCTGGFVTAEDVTETAVDEEGVSETVDSAMLADDSATLGLSFSS